MSISHITPNVTWSEKILKFFLLEKSILMQIYTIFKCPELPVHRTLLENFEHFNIYMYKYAIPT
mgnify:CR=1 FL=1